MTVVTMKISDNPLKGQPGQTDFSITVSSEPDMELPADGSMPDPEDVPLPILVAMEMVNHITGLTHEAIYIKVAKGEMN